jgi:hypothetical protein
MRAVQVASSCQPAKAAAAAQGALVTGQLLAWHCKQQRLHAGGWQAVRPNSACMVYQFLSHAANCYGLAQNLFDSVWLLQLLLFITPSPQGLCIHTLCCV